MCRTVGTSAVSAMADAQGNTSAPPEPPEGAKPAAEAEAKASEVKPKKRKKSKGPDPLIGKVVNDRFRIVSMIARGGMGKVYRAEQAPLGREVALKVLNPNYHGDHDPEFHKRFFLEASICSKLTHPNTVTIFDYGRTDDDVYYIAMELLEGRTLHRALRDDGRMDPGRAMHIARQVCRSLREAHSLGVIHRDLKPANIYLVKHGDEQDFVKVLDFGLVKDIGDKGEDLTQTGLFMGSPKYMSPEQIRGEKVDGRCDVYALGVILYEMLTGKVPFDRPNSVNILMAHVHEAPPSLTDMAPEAEFSQVLEQIVMKSMAKDPEERYGSMDEFLVALKQAASASGLAVSRSGETALSGEFAISGGATGSFTPVQLTGDPMATPSGVLTPSGSGAVVTGTSSAGIILPDETPKKGGKGKLLLVAALVLLAGIGGVFALQQKEPEPPPVVATPEPEPEPEPEVEPEPEPEPAVMEPEIARVMVNLSSTPSGATVVVGEDELGSTPSSIEWTGDEAERGREVTFRFQLDGHRDFTVTRTIIGDALDVTATLEAVAQSPTRMIRRPIRRSSSSMMTTSSGGPAIGVKGYKAEPY